MRLDLDIFGRFFLVIYVWMIMTKADISEQTLYIKIILIISLYCIFPDNGKIAPLTLPLCAHFTFLHFYSSIFTFYILQQ
jgi:hypothetical protein